MTSEKDISRFLSLVLRHEPGKIGLILDPQGWTEVDALLAALPFELDRDGLTTIVRNSDKQRFALSADGRMIRANQGHSVTVDLALKPQEPPEVLYHGTVEKVLPAILSKGLIKGERHHVHLSATVEAAQVVAARRGAPVVLRIAAGQMHGSGMLFFRSENGVWLTDHVPPAFLSRH